MRRPVHQMVTARLREGMCSPGPAMSILPDAPDEQRAGPSPRKSFQIFGLRCRSGTLRWPHNPLVPGSTPGGPTSIHGGFRGDQRIGDSCLSGPCSHHVAR
jgi:hypothetical protein